MNRTNSRILSEDKIEALVMKKIETSIKSLFKKDYFLLRSKQERAVNYRLVIYLQHLFKDWDVDGEYNRKNLITKELDGIKDSNKSTNRVIPDIIIHKRNTSKNFIVIEVKLCNRPIKYDKRKLSLFTNLKGKFHYFIGLLLKFKIIHENLLITKILVYKDGKLHETINLRFNSENNKSQSCEYRKSVDMSQIDPWGGEATDLDDYELQQKKTEEGDFYHKV